MSKEQYNTFDDWFREAAAQPGPPVHDAAWQAMEARLNDQKKRRRGIIFWWFFGGLFLAGGLIMLVRMGNSSIGHDKISDKISATELVNQQPQKQPKLRQHVAGKEEHATNPGAKTGNAEEIIIGEKQPDLELTGTGSGSINKPAEQNYQASSTIFKSRPTKKSNKVSISSDTGTSLPDKAGKKGKKAAALLTVSDVHSSGKGAREKSGVDQANEEAVEENRVVTDEAGLAAAKPAPDSTVQDTGKADSTEKKVSPALGQKKPAKTPEKKTHFYVFGTAAPEWSFVKKRGAGDMAISYGGGIGYMFSKKWAVQAGLFKAGKKYHAGPGDYTPKPGSYYDNPDYIIESVTADCDILEIPVAVRYTFLQRKKTQYFAMAGVTSVIMKKEAYDYDYLRYGNPRYASYTYTTGTFHLFSTASFSVGLEQKLNRNFSLLFAPYINIPLQGIGEGKVYLNSFGLQGGLKYNLPF